MLASNVQKAQCLTSSFYRRNTASKAPRKRNFLVCVQSRAPRSVGAVVGGGDGDGKGPRDPRICCWDNNDNSGEGSGPSIPQFSHGLACVAAAGALVSWANPAIAESLKAEDADFSVYVSFDSTNLKYESDQAVNSGICLSEEEKELLDPKQYRVREWVYVH